MNAARWLTRLKLRLEWPMIVLGLLWLVLFVWDLAWGLPSPLPLLVDAIWVVFVLEFLLRLALAPSRRGFLRQNWLAAIALLLPALRVFRVASALRAARLLRVLGNARGARSMLLLRSLGTANRGIGSVEQLLESRRDQDCIQLGLVPAATPGAEARVQSACRELARDLAPALGACTGVQWQVRLAEPKALADAEPRVGTDFLDMATTATGHCGLDIALVVTDAALSSSRNRLVGGLASSVAQLAVLSLHKLEAAAGAGAPVRDAAAVRWNAVQLAMHLVGHLLGLRHRSGAGVMRPFRFDPALVGPPAFGRHEQQLIAQVIRGVPEHGIASGSPLAVFLFHLAMAARHPAKVLKTVWRSGALLLSLRLPSLVVAAVAPSFVLVFTAEIWDVGFGMSNARVVQFALLGMASATLYLSLSRDLFFPRREKRVLSEHTAVLNVSIFATVLSAVVGVFLMLALLMLSIEMYFFPADLMATWPTLERPVVTWQDKLRLAAFIGGIGVITGALAGGMETSVLIRHLAVFEPEP